MQISQDAQAVVAGVNKDVWADSVVKEEYNQVLGEVTKALHRGDDENAAQLLNHYQISNASMNDLVQSASVQQSLDQARKLEQEVRDRQVSKSKLLDLSTKSFQGRRSGSSSLY